MKTTTANFGAVPDLYGESDTGVDAKDLLWHVFQNIVENNTSSPSNRNGPTVEYRQEAISTSDYHAKLEAEAQKTKREATSGDVDEHANVDESRVRYWSDYSRVFFHHRSMHRLPDVPEWEDVEGDWTKSSETFEKYDEVGESTVFRRSMLSYTVLRSTTSWMTPFASLSKNATTFR